MCTEEQAPIITITPTELSGVLSSTIYIRVFIQNSLISGTWSRADGRPLPPNTVQLSDNTLQVPKNFSPAMIFFSFADFQNFSELDLAIK